MWKSHGHFDLKIYRVQYPWLNSLLALNMNLQNVNKVQFSLVSGQPQDRVMLRKLSVDVADIP